MTKSPEDWICPDCGEEDQSQFTASAKVGASPVCGGCGEINMFPRVARRSEIEREKRRDNEMQELIAKESQGKKARW